jgi:DUF2934 family protein
MMTASPDARKRKPQSRKRKAQELVPVNPEGTQAPIHTCEDLHDRISQRAHELYVERGHRDGCSLQDWFDAEREILNHEQPV